MDDRSRMLLGNDRSVIVFLAVAIAASTAIVFMMNAARSGTYTAHEVSAFYRLFLIGDYPAALLFPLVLLASLSRRVQDLGWGLAIALGREPVRASLAAFLAFAVGSYAVYRAHPLAMDEYVPYLQSRIFLAGHLYGQFPPDLLDWLVFSNFQNHFIHVSHDTGQIISAYWPGFALLLVPFTALGVPWLCNPALGACAVWVLHRLTLQMTGSVEAAGAALLFAFASAAFSINSISFYSMTAHLLCNALFVLLLLQRSRATALLAGTVGGFALILHNPVPHALFAAPWLLWMLVNRNQRRRVPALIAGYLPWVVIVGFGWQYLLQALHQADAAAGTAAASGSPLAGLMSTAASVFRLPTERLLDARLIGLAKVWLWAVPALPLLALIGWWRRRTVSSDLLLLSAALTLAGYLFVPVSQGHGWGYRYFHSAWIVLPLLAAATIARPNGSGVGMGEHGLASIARYMHGVALASLVVLVPYFTWQVGTFMRDHLAQIPVADSGTPRIVIVTRDFGYYQQDLVQNDPFLRDPVIVMLSRGRTEDERMMARNFPGLELLSSDHRGTVWGHSNGD